MCLKEGCQDHKPNQPSNNGRGGVLGSGIILGKGNVVGGGTAEHGRVSGICGILNNIILQILAVS